MWRTHTGSTYSRGCHADEDVVAGELVRLGGGALLGDAALLALEDGEGRHVECGGLNDADLGADCVVNLIDGGRNCLTGEKLMRKATNGNEAVFIEECTFLGRPPRSHIEF